MARSYLSKFGASQKNLVKIGIGNLRGLLQEIKRIEGDGDEKRFVKKKAKLLRKAKKELSEADFNALSNELRSGKYRASKINIIRTEEENAVFPVSDEDVFWLIDQFSGLDLLPVQVIKFEVYDAHDRFNELIPGIEVPNALGKYKLFGNEITINGLIIRNQSHSMIKHVIFYHKVIFLSTISHEIFHNIDFKSTRNRKGATNENKLKGAEGFAYSLQAEFFKDYIVPYIKEAYSEDYQAFVSWMSELGVLPLEIEYWMGSLPYPFINDGITDLFSGVGKAQPALVLNLIIAKKMCIPEYFDKSLSYCNYILSEISPNNYEAKALKAKVLSRMSNYNEAEEIYISIIDTIKRNSDNNSIRRCAYTKQQLSKYSEAYDLYKYAEPLDRGALIYFVKCLIKLNKTDEVDRLIHDIETNKYFDAKKNDSQEIADFYLMFIHAELKNYEKSLKYFNGLNYKDLYEWAELQAKYLALKIYLVLKDYRKAKYIITSIERNKDKYDYHFHLVKRIMRLRNRFNFRKK